MSDESPWQTKSQMMVTLGKSSRTVDLYVKAGKIERMMDGSRAYFRLADPRNAVTSATTAQSSPELLAMLAEMRDELRGLRDEVAALRSALPPAQLPAGDAELPGSAELPADRNAPQPGNAPLRRSWLHRLLFGPT